MKEIVIASGDVALVSDADYSFLTHWKWKRHPQGYAARTGYINRKFVTFLMHRVILPPGEGQEVHHINGNKLDNRRENLAVVDALEHRLMHMGPILASCVRRQKNPLTKPCAHCGRVFAPKRPRRKRAKYCSPECVSMTAAARAAGRNHWNSSITEAQVLDIKRRLANGERQIDVYETTGVSKSIVGHIARGDRWKHVILAARDEEASA